MRRALSFAGAVVLLGVAAAVVGPHLAGAQGQGQCPAEADAKASDDGTVEGVTVDFSEDRTDVTVTAPSDSDVRVWAFGGTDKLVFLGVVEAGATATFSDPLTGPQGQPQQISHICLALEAAQETTTTTAPPTTTTTTSPTTTTTTTTTTTVPPTTTTTGVGEVVETTTTTIPPTTTTVGVAGDVETTTTAPPTTTTTAEAEVGGVTVEQQPEEERAEPAPAPPADAREAQPAFTG